MVRSIQCQMLTRKKNFTYICICSKINTPGVFNKISDTNFGAKEIGYNVVDNIISTNNNNIITYLIFHLNIIKQSESIIFIRYPNFLRVLLIFSILIARFRNNFIIVDIPTPLCILSNEIISRKNKNIYDYISLLELKIFGPISLVFANKVLQYSVESFWFSFFIKNRMKLIGNGIDLKRIKPRLTFPNWPNENLYLIGVANPAYWHGFDRIITTMKYFEDNKLLNYKIYFTIIGEGPELNNLKIMTNKFHLNKYVKFTGIINNQELLNTYYSNSHIAIASLGLYRKKLNIASELKAREYTAVGIPFIASAIDPDFSEYNTFRFLVENNDSINDLLNLFQKLPKITFDAPVKIREYATTNLSMTKKLKDYIL